MRPPCALQDEKTAAQNRRVSLRTFLKMNTKKLLPLVLVPMAGLVVAKYPLLPQNQQYKIAGTIKLG
jgi:peptidoglycan/LPS O-acetylase OafA/YrhL